MVEVGRVFRLAKRDFGGVEGDVLRKRRQREDGNGQREEGLCGSFHDVGLPHGSLNEFDCSRPPGLVKPGLQRAVKTENAEPAFAGWSTPTEWPDRIVSA